MEARLLAAHAAAGAMHDLPRRRFALTKQRGDFGVAAVEHVVQQERRPFFGREPLEQHEERDRQVGGQLGVPIGRRRWRADERLGQPGPDVGLALHLERAQAVDREARRGRHQPGLGVAHGRLVGLVPADVGLLHDVFGLGSRAEHAVGEAEEARLDGVEGGSGSHLEAKTMAASIVTAGGAGSALSSLR